MPAIPRVTVAAFANRAIASGMNHVGARGTDEQQRPCGDIGKVVVTQASVEAASYAGERLGRNGTVLEVAGMLTMG